jgi:hypothetical protein
MRRAMACFGFIVATGTATLLLAATPARFEPCTIVNGEVKTCSGFTTGEVIFTDQSETKPSNQSPPLRRCQCTRGLVRKCQPVAYDGWTVRQSTVDGKYYECKVEAGVVGDCKKKPYTGDADLVICVASNCSPPFPPQQEK